MNILLTDYFYVVVVVVVVANLRLCEIVSKPEEASRAYPRSMCVGTRIQEWVREVEPLTWEKRLQRPASRCRSTVLHSSKHFYTAFGLMEN